MKQVKRRTMVEKTIIEFVKECDKVDFYWRNSKYGAIEGTGKECWMNHQAKLDALTEVLKIFGLTEDEIADLEQLDPIELNWKTFDEWCNVALTY